MPFETHITNWHVLKRILPNLKSKDGQCNRHLHTARGSLNDNNGVRKLVGPISHIWWP
jgi:hypothetical protein